MLRFAFVQYAIANLRHIPIKKGSSYQLTHKLLRKNMNRFAYLLSRLCLIFCLATAVSVTVFAAEQNMLTRDEVTSLKKKLVAVFNAMGQPPSGYVKEDEQFNLPTEVYKKGNTGKYEWVTPSMTSRFSGGGEKEAKKSGEQLQQEYEKKVAEAIAKGNYEEISKLAEEMQKKVGEAQLAAVEGRKVPIEIRIMLNTYETQTLDSDMIVFEKPGVIALIVDNKDENRNRLLVCFDPITLKETKTLSRMELKQPDDGVSKKTAVLNATIEIIGPASETKAWANQINIGAVLGQIDSGR
jgi:hypothetical protein